MGINLTCMISMFQIQTNLFHNNSSGKRKMKNNFKLFLLYSLYRVKILENLEDGIIGPKKILCMLTLIHIMGKHHVHWIFHKKCLLTRPNLEPLVALTSPRVLGSCDELEWHYHFLS